MRYGEAQGNENGGVNPVTPPNRPIQLTGMIILDPARASVPGS